MYGERLNHKDRDVFELLPGYTCNASCQFCSVADSAKKTTMSTDQVMTKIYCARKEGFKYLGIGGGEPTIRKDLVALVSFAKRIKFEAVRIETNGIALAYSSLCKHLVQAGLDFVKISIHGHTSKIHDALTRTPGSFKKVLKAIENLQKLKVRIEINTVINKFNYKNYADFLRFFVRYGIGSFCFIYPVYSGRMLKYHKKIGVSMQSVAPYLKDVLKLADALEIDKALVFNMPPCYLGGYTSHIVELDPFNTKVVAPDYTIESIDHMRFAEKIKSAQCQRCRFSEKCDGIWKQYINIFNDRDINQING